MPMHRRSQLKLLNDLCFCRSAELVQRSCLSKGGGGSRGWVTMISPRKLFALTDTAWRSAWNSSGASDFRVRSTRSGSHACLNGYAGSGWL
jgi:hypothetical protein